MRSVGLIFAAMICHLVTVLLTISTQGLLLSFALPSLPFPGVRPRNDGHCDSGKTKHWRYDAEIEASTCWLSSGDEIVDVSGFSEEDVDDMLKLYRGLLKTEDEIRQVPVSDANIVPLDFPPQSGAPPTGGLGEGLGGSGVQTIGLGSPDIGTSVGASNARSPARASSAATATRTAAGVGCCSVTREWTRPNTMENRDGVLRSLVHFPSRGVYQYINTGRCVSPGSACSGGRCYTDQITIYLAVFLPEQGDNVIGFESFSVDNHCTCFNFGK